MYNKILESIKSSNIIREIAISAIGGYFISRLIIENPYYAILFIVLPFTGISLFLSKSRANNILLNFQQLIFIPLIFLYVIEMPKIGPLPLSPVFILIAIYILYSLMNAKDFFSMLKLPSGKIFSIIFLCGVYQYIVNMFFTNAPMLNLELIEFVGVIIGIRAFVINRAERAIWATRIFAGVLIISMFWFLMEIYTGEASPTRLIIYQSLMKNSEYSATMMLPNGLSTYPFIFGYQIAASISLTLMFIFIEKEMSWRILWIIGSICSILAMFFSGERSVIVAVGLTLFIYLYSEKRLKAAIIIPIILFLSFGISTKLYVAQNTIQKIQDSEKNVEGWDRIKLQVVGLKVALENPLGLTMTGGDWSEKAISAGADFSAWQYRAIPVHNGYLGRIISYGWVMGVFIILFFYHIWKAMKRVLFINNNKLTDIQHKYAKITGFSVLSILIQALFHNSSIFSFNSISLSVIIIFLTWIDIVITNNDVILKYSDINK